MKTFEEQNSHNGAGQGEPVEITSTSEESWTEPSTAHMLMMALEKNPKPKIGGQILAIPKTQSWMDDDALRDARRNSYGGGREDRNHKPQHLCEKNTPRSGTGQTHKKAQITQTPMSSHTRMCAEKKLMARSSSISKRNWDETLSNGVRKRPGNELLLLWMQYVRSREWPTQTRIRGAEKTMGSPADAPASTARSRSGRG